MLYQLSYASVELDRANYTQRKHPSNEFWRNSYDEERS